VGYFKIIDNRLVRLAAGGSGQELDDILADLVATLLESRTRPGNNYRVAQKAAPPNDNNGNQFNYARYQEIYRKCPCKLVDMAIAGTTTFSARIDPPQARNVRELYTELWNTSRPEGIPPSAELGLQSIGVGEFLVPIGHNEIIRRLTGIKTSTAVGLDRVAKAHLRMRSPSSR